MKKILMIFNIFLLTIILSGCSKETNSFLINVYLEGTDKNNAISLYNFSDEEVSLKNYSIGIYDSKDPNKLISEVKFGDKSVDSKDVFVIANNKSEEKILSHADMTDKNLSFGGRENIALLLKGEKVDVVGNFSATAVNTNMRGVTLVRKVNHDKPTATFDQYDWILYGSDNVNYLDEFKNSVTPEEFLEGPKYSKDSEFFDKPFVNPETKLGGGGFTNITLLSNVDGDTANFRWNDLDYDQVFNTTTGKGTGFSAKARYLDIDTPESFSGGIQEFGIVAKKFTAKIQDEAKEMHAQSGINNSLSDTYSRVLSYIYADEIMVNYLIIKHGYTNDTYGGMDMYYKDIPFYGYFLNADLYARKNKLGFYGEKDPYWDYDNNKSIYD